MADAPTLEKVVEGKLSSRSEHAITSVSHIHLSDARAAAHGARCAATCRASSICGSARPGEQRSELSSIGRERLVLEIVVGCSREVEHHASIYPPDSYCWDRGPLMPRLGVAQPVFPDRPVRVIVAIFCRRGWGHHRPFDWSTAIAATRPAFYRRKSAGRRRQYRYRGRPPGSPRTATRFF